MDNWKQKEEYVRLLTGGERTPGSGCGRLKGDVRLDLEGWIVEVKSTVGKLFCLRRNMLDKLASQSRGYDAALVLFAQNEGIVYYKMEVTDDEPETWHSKMCDVSKLPASIVTGGHRWELDTNLESLRNLK
jgi:hypothetical protein